MTNGHYLEVAKEFEKVFAGCDFAKSSLGFYIDVDVAEKFTTYKLAWDVATARICAEKDAEIERLRKFELTSPSQMELQRQVAMQLEVIVEMRSHEGRTLVQKMADKAISYTQATAEAYERELSVKVLEKYAQRMMNLYDEKVLRDAVEELRADNKEEEDLTDFGMEQYYERGY